MSKKQRPRPPRGVRFAASRSSEDYTIVELNSDEDQFIEVGPDEVFICLPHSSVSVPLNAVVHALRLHYWRVAK